MHFHHTIQACDNAEDPMWYVVIMGDEAEEYEGTAAQYGRDVLQNWIDDPGNWEDGKDKKIKDEYDNPYLRVLVHFGDDEERDERDPVATIESNDLDEPTAEITAVEAARDAKLYAKHLARQADIQLEDALMVARAANHGANDLARLAYPAVSRPIALQMMRPDTYRGFAVK